MKNKNKNIKNELKRLEELENSKPSNSKIEKSLKPITTKQLIVKLIPFMLFVLVGLGFIICIFVLPSIHEYEFKEKLSMYLFAPILMIILVIPSFVLFDKPFCKYNLKHNTKMKKFLSKFVKLYSDNGCFKLREIYNKNPLQYAWDMKGEKIIEKYKEWDLEAFNKDIEFYREHQF